MNSSDRGNGRCPLPESRLLWPKDETVAQAVTGQPFPPLPENEKNNLFLSSSLFLYWKEKQVQGRILIT